MSRKNCFTLWCTREDLCPDCAAESSPSAPGSARPELPPSTDIYQAQPK